MLCSNLGRREEAKVRFVVAVTKPKKNYCTQMHSWDRGRTSRLPALVGRDELPKEQHPASMYLSLHPPHGPHELRGSPWHPEAAPGPPTPHGGAAAPRKEGCGAEAPPNQLTKTPPNKGNKTHIKTVDKISIVPTATPCVPERSSETPLLFPGDKTSGMFIFVELTLLALPTSHRNSSSSRELRIFVWCETEESHTC